MGKLIVLLCFAILATTLVTACFKPGAPCQSHSDCCGGFRCNQYDQISLCNGQPAPDKNGVPGTWGPGGPWGFTKSWGPRGPGAGIQ